MRKKNPGTHPNSIYIHSAKDNIETLASVIKIPREKTQQRTSLLDEILWAPFEHIRQSRRGWTMNDQELTMTP